jgi:Ca-activated chloride channel homolog
VKELARVGNGAAEFVYPGERIEGKVLRQFRRALSPALRDVTLEWNGTLATQIPEALGPVFCSDPLRLYAFVHELREGPVTLRASGADGPLSWSLALDPTSVADGEMLGVLAARLRIRELEEGGMYLGRGSRQRDRKDDRVVSEIVRLAIEYGLASRETSWVAIEKRDLPATTDAVLRRVPIALTSGWGGEDTRHGARLAMTDTGAFDSAMLGRSLGTPELHRAAPTSSRVPVPSLSWNWLRRLRSGPARATDPSTGLSNLRTARSSSRESTRPLDVLIGLQGADGAWHLDQALADALTLPLPELQRRLAGAIGDSAEASRAWATALALAFLGRECSSNRDEWELLAAKAKRWLAGVAARPPAGASWIDFAQTELDSSAWSLRDASTENQV